MRSITFCTETPGRKMDDVNWAVPSDPFISFERFPTLEMPSSIKEHV